MLLSETQIRKIIRNVLKEEMIASKDAMNAKSKAGNNNVSEYIRNLEQNIKNLFGNKRFEIKVYENDQDADIPEYELETEKFNDLKSFLQRTFKSYESVQTLSDSIESLYTSKENKDYKVFIKRV